MNKEETIYLIPFKVTYVECGEATIENEYIYAGWDEGIHIEVKDLDKFEKLKKGGSDEHL